jgi:hypothetical protein
LSIFLPGRDGCAHNSHINRNRLIAAELFNAPLFQRATAWPAYSHYVANLIEEQSATICLLEFSLRRAAAPVKAPFHKKSDSISSLGRAAQFTAIKAPSRVVLRRAPARNQLFARADSPRTRTVASVSRPRAIAPPAASLWSCRQRAALSFQLQRAVQRTILTAQFDRLKSVLDDQTQIPARKASRHNRKRRP